MVNDSPPQSLTTTRLRVVPPWSTKLTISPFRSRQRALLNISVLPETLLQVHPEQYSVVLDEVYLLIVRTTWLDFNICESKRVFLTTLVPHRKSLSIRTDSRYPTTDFFASFRHLDEPAGFYLTVHSDYFPFFVLVGHRPGLGGYLCLFTIPRTVLLLRVHLLLFSAFRHLPARLRIRHHHRRSFLVPSLITFEIATRKMTTIKIKMTN